jgi:signal transduction histidine kinase
VRGNLQRDLFRLGVVPCAAVALALTGWFTHNRLQTLEAQFDAEGQAVARQVAAMSDLSLYAGDVPALQNVANAALRGGQVMRVEISNSAGVYVTAGPKTESLAQLRMFTSPVTLREASRASAFAPAGSTAAGDTPIGLVQTFRDTTAYARERSRSLIAGIGIALVALLAAWASVRHMARTVARPLRRVSRTVAALEAGHFDMRCEVVEGGTRGTHELAVLAHDIDRLAERLQHNRQVSEERVREATAVALQRMAEAEQAALSRARFLAAASHDLRQPLHAMGLFIDGLLPTATAAQRPAVLRLQESTEFMGVLLDDLLEISRLDAQVLTPAITRISLAALFDQLDAQHAAAAIEARVRLRWSDRGLAVRTDAAMLQRIVNNLVANALRHAPEGGTVLVAARRSAAGVRIEVRDNGVGIAPIHQGPDLRGVLPGGEHRARPPPGLWPGSGDLRAHRDAAGHPHHRALGAAGRQHLRLHAARRARRRRRAARARTRDARAARGPALPGGGRRPRHPRRQPRAAGAMGLRGRMRDHRRRGHRAAGHRRHPFRCGAVRPAAGRRRRRRGRDRGRQAPAARRARGAGLGRDRARGAAAAAAWRGDAADQAGAAGEVAGVAHHAAPRAGASPRARGTFTLTSKRR